MTPPALTEQLKQLNTVADSMSGGESAPSVADATAILDAANDVHVPRSFAQLRYGIERMHAFYEVLLGPRHIFNLRLREFHQHLVIREADLEMEVPRNAAHRGLVPALLARRLQIDSQVWLADQGRTDAQCPVPNFSEVFWRNRPQKRLGT